MKKVIFLLTAAIMLQGCATILSGPKTDCQEKQKTGEVKKEVQVGYLVADIIFFPIPLVVDLLTGKLYRPEAKSCSNP